MPWPALARARRQPDVSRLILAPLAFYKRWISPLLGQRCRFQPSCSDYARIAVARFGALRGSWLATLRLLRCQPLCAAGHDPVPLQFAWFPRRAENPTNGNDHD
ncbi:MAG: membrane protein insertion efficiency factor YidD [Xanthomonadales bacterium]|nr:membrane protein insertion efficiency factor YidD [Xanthomonadales bacterium]